jgi:hypothetical protein
MDDDFCAIFITACKVKSCHTQGVKRRFKGKVGLEDDLDVVQVVVPDSVPEHNSGFLRDFDERLSLPRERLGCRPLPGEYRLNPFY